MKSKLPLKIIIAVLLFFLFGTPVAFADQGLKESLEARNNARFAKLVEVVVNRFDATIGRFDKIVIRIESRIAKIEARGGSAPEAKVLLEEAKSQIETAKTSILSIQSIQTETNAEGKDQFDRAKEDIKTVQDTLIKVVESLALIEN